MKLANIDRDSLILSILGALAAIYLVLSGKLVLSVILASVVVRLLTGYTELRLVSIQARFFSAAFAIVLLASIVFVAGMDLERHFVVLNIFSGMSLPSIVVSMFKKSKEPRR